MSELRDRIIAATSELATNEGWSSVTMSRVALMVGVSRQSVYNEVGSKQQLAEAMVSAEATKFFAAVAEELSGGGTLTQAMERIGRRVFEMAQSNALLQALVSMAHGSSSDLLPLLTTRSQPIVERSSDLIVRLVQREYPDEIADVQRLPQAVDAAVRLVLSHIMRPGGDPDEISEQIGWVIERLIVNQQVR